MKKAVLICVLFFLTSCVFAAKIDLAVSSSDVTISPAQPKAGDSVSVTVKVHSQGTKASKASIVKLKMTKGSTKIFNQKNSIPAIAVGESYDTLFNIGALQEGTYNLLIKVDPANAIPETNEGNNIVNLTLTVSGGSSGGAGQVATNIVATTFTTSFEAAGNIGKIGGGNQKSSFKENLYNLFQLAKNPEETINCGKSGTTTINYQLDTYLRPIKIEFIYDNCENWEDQSTNSYERINGSMTIELTYLSDNILSPDFYTINQMVVETGDGNPSSDTMPDYSCEYYKNGALNDRIVSDYTLTISIFGYDNDGMPTDIGMYLTGTIMQIAPGVNYTMTFNNLHYDISMSGTEEDMTISITIAGTTSCVYDENQAKKITVTYNNVNITSHTYGTTAESTINGQMEVQSPCYTGTVSVETIQPIHEVEDSECPDGGKLKVTAGGKSATVTFNSDGSISVDENSDGSVDYTFANCNDAFKYPC